LRRPFQREVSKSAYCVEKGEAAAQKGGGVREAVIRQATTAKQARRCSDRVAVKWGRVSVL